MPVGSGYSVEAQVTGSENVGGLQFEITPKASQASHSFGGSGLTIFFQDDRFSHKIQCTTGTTIKFLKGELENRCGQCSQEMLFLWAGEQLLGIVNLIED
jgi:hypothetical protein